MTSGWWDDGKVSTAINTPAPPPRDGPAFVRWAGGRRQVAELLSGMSGPPRKADYADDGSYQAARTRWRTASRRAQRMDDEGKPGKQRRGAPRLTPVARERVDELERDRRFARFVLNGARVRLTVTVRINTPDPRKPDETRTREIPSGGPGELVPAEEVADVLGLLESRDPSDAELALVDYVLVEYFGEGIDAEVEDVISVKVWPDGDPEPA